MIWQESRCFFEHIALKDNISDVVSFYFGGLLIFINLSIYWCMIDQRTVIESLYTSLFNESFKIWCRGLVVYNFTTGQTYCSYILVILLNCLILNRLSHQDLKQHSLHPLHSKAHAGPFILKSIYTDSF